MSTEYLRDEHFRVIGSITTEASGKQVARNAAFQLVGTYDPKTHRTFDSHFRSIGTGNQLSALIARSVE